MRIFTLFLILNIIVCYGGMCRSASADTNSDYQIKESCHKMNHHGSAKNNSAIKQDYSHNESPRLSCCDEMLINYTNYENINVYFSYIPNYKDEFCVKRPQTVRVLHSPNTHDPPDLLLLNSTFLI